MAFESLDEANVKKGTTNKVIPSGIPGLDEVIGGGLPDKSVFLLVGDSATHVTTFAQQVLYNHVITKGKVAYYLVEQLSSDIMEDMAFYTWNIKSYVTDQAWLFIKVQTPELVNLSRLMPDNSLEPKVFVSPSSLTNLSQDFLERVKEGRWTALHLTHLLLRCEFTAIEEFLLYWTMVVRAHGGIHFLIASELPGQEGKLARLKELADGVLEFQTVPRGTEVDEVFTAKKIRRLLAKPKVVPFDIREDGIVVQTLQRVL